MSIITITNGLYSNAKETVDKLSETINAKIITDSEIIEGTHLAYDIKLASLQKVVESKPIAFNDFTHEKEKCLAFLEKTISDFVSEGDCIFYGMLGHLIPSQISHAMKVLIITDKKQRVENGIKLHGLTDKEALKNVDQSDKLVALWINELFDKKAWDESLYDIVIPTDKMSFDESVELISNNLEKLLLNKDELIKKEINDLKGFAEVNVVLSEIGQGLSAKVDSGNAVVQIDKKVLMLTKLQQKIVETVGEISNIKSVETTIGKNYYKGNIIHNYEFETPLRVLLVDDEKDFVQTLSERLKMRQFTSEIAYNGQEALDFTDQEDTEVMILDLKMPGIDGFEVLKKIKKTKPEIEVIILTGHGTEKDRKTCMDLGAFAYLQKPADIELITETMKQAYEKISLKRNKADH